MKKSVKMLAEPKTQYVILHYLSIKLVKRSLNIIILITLLFDKMLFSLQSHKCDNLLLLAKQFKFKIKILTF